MGSEMCIRDRSRFCDNIGLSRSKPGGEQEPRNRGKYGNQHQRETTARGLEYACCFERQKRTVRGREVLLRLASKVDASTLARIATQCNAWATQLAVEQALEDAAERINTRKKTRRAFADFVASKLRR